MNVFKTMAWWLSWLERRPVTAEVVGSNPIRVVFNLKLYIWDHSSAGRASALQAEGHRFEPYSGSLRIKKTTCLFILISLNKAPWSSG